MLKKKRTSFLYSEKFIFPLNQPEIIDQNNQQSRLIKQHLTNNKLIIYFIHKPKLKFFLNESKTQIPFPCLFLNAFATRILQLNVNFHHYNKTFST